jgi:hypothetical protein
MGRLVISVLLAAAPVAHALKFSELPGEDGRTYLVLHDCGVLSGENAKECPKYETQFSGPTEDDYGRLIYEGDAARLRRFLGNGKHYSRVVFYSGGGDLNEGIEIGNLLRQYRQFTWVPKGFECVSACTVAFLGGVIREVDPEGQYKVHAYSRFQTTDRKPFSQFSGQGAETQLQDDVERIEMAGRSYAYRLTAYVQTMIGGRPNEAAFGPLLASAEGFARAYRASAQWNADLARIRLEGTTATQEILMRLEREAFESYLGALKQRPDLLGDRADRAIQMLGIMFSSRIAGTAALDQTTLKEYGYINVRR